MTLEKQNFTITVQEGESSVLKLQLNEFTFLTLISTSYGGFLKGLIRVTCLNDDKIWTCGNSTTLSLYNLRRELNDSIETVSRNMSRDLAVTQSGNLVYFDLKMFAKHK